MAKKQSLISRNAIFKNFLGASTVSLLGSNIFDIAIPLYVLERTHSAMALAMANVALHLPFFLMAPLTGYTVDNFNKRRVMLVTDIGQVLCLIFLLLYDYAQFSNYWPILIAVFIAKTLMITFETVATFQLIPALVADSDLQEANSWFLSSQRFIQIFGPLIAGLLMSTAGIRSCTLVNILTFAATLYFVLKITNLNELIEGGEQTAAKKSMTIGGVIDSFIDSIRYIWKSKLFRPFILMMFVWNFSALIPNSPSVIYYFNVEKHLSTAHYGTLVSIFGVLGILGFLVAGPLYRRHDFSAPFVGGGILVAVTSTLSLFFYDSPYILAAIFSLSRIGTSVVSMGTFFLRQTNIPKSKTGGVNAALRMFFMSSAPLSALLQGILLERFGVKLSFAIGAICLWLTVWYAIRVARAYTAKPHVIPTGKTAVGI